MAAVRQYLAIVGRLRSLERRVQLARPGSREYRDAAAELDRVSRKAMDRYRRTARALA